jgi:predicted esterase
MSGQEDFSTFAEGMFGLYRAGKYGPALEYVERGMAAFPDHTARITFWRLCLLSLCGRSDEALSVLSEGLDAGLWYHEFMFRDTDLDSLRELPRFKELATRSQERWIKEASNLKSDRTTLVPAGSGPQPLLIALHGHSGNKDDNLQYWEIPSRHGWMVLSVQSRLPAYPGAYFWEARSGIEDILSQLLEIRRNYHIDAKRIVVAGMSQGGGMAVLAALSPKIEAAGSISVAAAGLEVEPFKTAAKGGKGTRCYFVSGLKDHTLGRSREIQAVLKNHHIPVEEEVHTDLGHDFPPDFEKSLEKAFKFILP